MTVPAERCPEGACSQVFTERYGEFIFGNDTVTALDPDWDPLKDSRSKAWAAGQVKACWWAHSRVLWWWWP
jgi:hypothetical protein